MEFPFPCWIGDGIEGASGKGISVMHMFASNQLIGNGHLDQPTRACEWCL